MKWGRLLAVVATAGAVAAASGCKDQPVRDYLGEVVKDQNGKIVKGQLTDWLDSAGVAICQIEKQTQGLDPTKKLCPDPTKPIDQTPPPTYPPL